MDVKCHGEYYLLQRRGFKDCQNISCGRRGINPSSFHFCPYKPTTTDTFSPNISNMESENTDLIHSKTNQRRRFKGERTPSDKDIGIL